MVVPCVWQKNAEPRFFNRLRGAQTGDGREINLHEHNKKLRLAQQVYTNTMQL